jgi:hypothetical protein
MSTPAWPPRLDRSVAFRHHRRWRLLTLTAGNAIALDST